MLRREVDGDMALVLRNRRRNDRAEQVWSALSEDARRHFEQAPRGCGCSACWLLRANGLLVAPHEEQAAS